MSNTLIDIRHFLKRPWKEGERSNILKALDELNKKIGNLLLFSSFYEGDCIIIRKRAGTVLWRCEKVDAEEIKMGKKGRINVKEEV